jgi:hypothetical protein
MSDEEHIIFWEAPIIVKPEFRLYYDDKGYLICYTCEKLEGNYIVIDATTFAESRPDVRVIDGRLVKSNTGAVVSRLYPSTEGTLCEVEDISIIAESIGRHWKLKTYQVRNNDE